MISFFKRLAGKPPLRAGADRLREVEYLLTEFREHGWNISLTAGAVGVAREGFSRKIETLGIEVERG